MGRVNKEEMDVVAPTLRSALTGKRLHGDHQRKGIASPAVVD